MRHVHTSLCSLQKSHYRQSVLEIALWEVFAVRDKYVSLHYELFRQLQIIHTEGSHAHSEGELRL